jgi:hypothetical protein
VPHLGLQPNSEAGGTAPVAYGTDCPQRGHTQGRVLSAILTGPAGSPPRIAPGERRRSGGDLGGAPPRFRERASGAQARTTRTRSRHFLQIFISLSCNHLRPRQPRSCRLRARRRARRPPYKGSSSCAPANRCPFAHPPYPCPPTSSNIRPDPPQGGWGGGGGAGGGDLSPPITKPASSSADQPIEPTATTELSEQKFCPPQPRAIGANRNNRTIRTEKLPPLRPLSRPTHTSHAPPHSPPTTSLRLVGFLRAGAIQ